MAKAREPDPAEAARAADPRDATRAADPRDAARAGLCASCRHAARQPGARGSLFWRCLRADADASYLRYPPLPVRACRGHERHAAG